MFSSVQVVLLFDVNSLGGDCDTESELERNVAKLKLGSLKLLTEFGAKTEKGLEVVRWSSRFYDSFSYKPNTSRKNFVDFNKTSFEEFENGITDGFCSAFDRRQSDSHQKKNSHSFVLRKCLQEILLDYNWDGPDISSPVKKSGPTRRRSSRGAGNKVLPDNQGPYNTVIVFTNIPQSLEGVNEFCRVGSPRRGSSSRRSSSNVTGDDYLGDLLDPATYKGFQEDKRIHLNFVAVNSLQSLQQESGNKIYSVINAGLGKLGGGLHLIGNIVETLSSKHVQDDCQSSREELFPSPNSCSESIRIPTPWWKKSKATRPRRPQRGPTLVWEDAEGISNIQVELEVLAVHGSSSRNWGNASVVAVLQSSALSLLAMAGGTGHLYVCHAPNTVFTSLIQLLNMQQLSMLLKLSCGGVAVLSPWAGGVGSLAVVSASGLATPPLITNSSPRESKKINPSIQKFVTQSSMKCLKNAPAHMSGEPRGTTKRFAANKTERWFKPLSTCDNAIKRIVKKRANKAERLAMQERLQKKYRPQIPRLLATGEIEKVDLVDITQPPPEPEPGASTKPNMSRAQQLVKKSHIVTAQQKVKEQLAEEEERVQATERRAALASEQARKSQALESHVLNTVSDPQNTEELRQSLIQLRESSGKETDTYTTAQTIINLALMHIKSSNNVHIEDELGRVLGDGVLQSAADINSTYPAESRLSQYQLQTLLHLELLWLFGYSSSGVTDEEEQDSRGVNLREHHIGEAVKLLRAISLTHNPATMASFLQETILDNYGDTLGEVLVELYEELNQPLPEVLRVLSGDVNSVYPSLRSLGSGVGPESNCSVENPDSGKSREEKRMLRHPSLMEAGKNRIVVPMATRALKRTASEHTKATATSNKGPTLSNKGPTLSNKEAPENEVQKVRRNLFDLSEGPSKTRLKRSHTIDVPVTELRRSPRKKNRVFSSKSPLKNSSYQKTPVKETIVSAKGLRTPKLRRSGVLAPETPGNKVGQTIFNKKRIRKSTGTTLITESPEVKRACRTTPRRLRASLTVSRRNSFYSGARSRNWERAKTQLLADRIRGKSGQRRINQKSLQNLDASFLFTEIISGEHAVVTQCDDQANENDYIETPERKILNFEYNDADSEQNNVESDRTPLKGKLISKSSVKDDFKNEDSPAKNTRLSDKVGLRKSLSFGEDSRRTPLKNVRRALSLSTPSKILPFQNSINDYSCNSKMIASPEKHSILGGGALCPVTPKRIGRTNLDVGLCDVTPSKRVQFNFTPSKEFPASSNMRTPYGKGRSLSSDTPVTPKSILKTPKKTPNKTPIKARSFLSPDIFSSSKKIRVSPATTPLKTKQMMDAVKLSEHSLSSETSPSSQFSGFSDRVKTAVSPVEVNNIGCFEGSEIELVSPMKENRGSSKASLILHNTPKKGNAVGDSFDSKPCKLSFDEESEDGADDMDGVSDNSVNLDVDANSNISDLSHMKPEDIEMISNLLFENFDSNSGLDVGGLDDVNENETAKDDHENLRSLLSPLKYGCKPYVAAISSGDTQLVALPDKQEPQEELVQGLEHTVAGNHIDSSLLSESIEYSPLDDQNPLPTLDVFLNQYLVDDGNELQPDTEKQILNVSEMDGNELQPDTEKKILNVSEMVEQTGVNDSGCSFYDTDSTLSVSPEIPLDYQAICSIQKNRDPQGKDKSLDAPERKGESLDALEVKGESLNDLEKSESLDALEGGGGSLDAFEGKGKSLGALEVKDGNLNDLKGKGESLDALEGKEESLDALGGKGKGLDAFEGKDENLDTLDGKSEKLENLVALEEKGECLYVLEGKGKSLGVLQGKDESMDDLEEKGESLDALEGKDKSLDVPKMKGQTLDVPDDIKSELSNKSDSDTIFDTEKVKKTSLTRVSSTGKRMLFSNGNEEEGVKRVSLGTRVTSKVSVKRKFSSDNDESERVPLKRRVSSGVSSKQKTPRDDDLEENEVKVHSAHPKRRLSKRKSSDVGEDLEAVSDYFEDDTDSDWNNEGKWSRRGRKKTQNTENIKSRVTKQKTGRKVKRQRTHISSTPANNGGLKRNSSDSSGREQQENNIESRRRLSRRVTRVGKERRKSQRMCRTKVNSLKEVSSDDESFGIFEDFTHSFDESKRIFDDDSDFISPEKSMKIGLLKELPLKNVANLPTKKGRANSTFTDESELHSTTAEEGYLNEKKSGNVTLPDYSELHSSGSNLDRSSSGLAKTPVKRGKQQKIDIYLSPVNEKLSDCKKQVPHHRTMQTTNKNRPQTPNDWKRIKPRHVFKRGVNGKRDVSQISPIDSSKCVNSNQGSSSNGFNKRRRKKKKGVKLKLTKSGDNYEVSKVDLSLDSSDRNSSTADPQKLLAESGITKGDSEENSPCAKKRKKSIDHQCIITPLRFTRHMSKDLSVTPELFSQLIALSPEKVEPKQSDSEAPQKKSGCEIRKRKRDLLKHFNGKGKKKQELIEDCKADSVVPLVNEDLLSSEWTVQNIPGSPTMKTFIRKQKRKYSIKSSPRVELSPLPDDALEGQTLIKPSLMSIAHLSVSPIMNTISEKTQKRNSRSSRKLYSKRSGIKD